MNNIFAFFNILSYRAYPYFIEDLRHFKKRSGRRPTPLGLVGVIKLRRVPEPVKGSPHNNKIYLTA